MAKKKLTATEGPTEPPRNARKHALQVRVTPDDEDRLERLQARYGLATAADVIRVAITLLDQTPAPKLRPKKSDQPS